MQPKPEIAQPVETPPEPPTPRNILFRTLTILWIFPSLGALWILFHESDWWQTEGVVSKILAVRAEQWVAFGLITCHLWFAWRWRNLQPTILKLRPTGQKKSKVGLARKNE